MHQCDPFVVVIDVISFIYCHDAMVRNCVMCKLKPLIFVSYNFTGKWMESGHIVVFFKN